MMKHNTSLLGIVLFPVMLLYSCSSKTEPELAGWAQLPSATFSDGPTSGQFIESKNGVPVPFENKQPVQGFSAILSTGNNRFLLLSDNGFGSKSNSSDYLLRVTMVSVSFAGSKAATSEIKVDGHLSLSDPQRLIPFKIVAEMENYPSGDGDIEVDAEIRENRLLTGADFDVESFRRTVAGDFWFGDEFGPFLLHTDSSGRVLEPPFQLPGVHSPDNPVAISGAGVNLGRSGGFEGIALSVDGQYLYPMLEKHISDRPETELQIHKFAVTTRQWSTDTPYRKYRLTSSEHRIGDFTAIGKGKFLVIERDGFQGDEARFKKIFLVDFEKLDPDGYLRKREIVDLLHISNPQAIGGFGANFTFPFETIESVDLVTPSRLVIANDNNYPGSVGRHIQSGQPDDNEIILIEFGRALMSLEID